MTMTIQQLETAILMLEGMVEDNQETHELTNSEAVKMWNHVCNLKNEVSERKDSIEAAAHYLINTPDLTSGSLSGILKLVPEKDEELVMIEAMKLSLNSCAGKSAKRKRYLNYVNFVNQVVSVEGLNPPGTLWDTL